ncbi:MAG TPA: N-6 DNA methylase [Thermoanaerobaculia bacterium]|jgi:hypothetical protein|nr:N-6 DNA methylase [Thermoanaerobaculia bacterium]
MQEFGAFVDELESFVKSILKRGGVVDSDRGRIAAALDGNAGAALRRLVNVSARRNAGAFFTGSSLANALVSPRAELIRQGAVVADPACGAGDLLIACATHMTTAPTLTQTLNSWGQRLCGSDLEPNFVRAAILRVILQAMSRVHVIDCADLATLKRYLGRIRCEDGLAVDRRDARLIVLNPPYGSSRAPDDCTWASGATARAALFYDAVLTAAPADCRLLALLPDVLRSGRRYEKWRSGVSKLTVIEGIRPAGLFDHWTDVDVFELAAIRVATSVERKVEWWATEMETMGPTLSDEFHVSVGPVVPFRDRKSGPAHPYIHPRNLEPWREVLPRDETRKYSGPVVAPPFVAIRRTSRPGDRHRATATIVKGESSVAVENHIIVCKPHDNTLRSCRTLMRRLREESTTIWLDERLRCRHLTVSAIRELPYEDNRR